MKDVAEKSNMRARLTLTPVSAAPLLTLFSPVNHRSSRAYPPLTAPNPGKTLLNALNRAKIFSEGSRACNRACPTQTATIVALCVRSLCVFRASVVNFSQGRQPTAKVGNCRRSKIRLNMPPLRSPAAPSPSTPAKSGQTSVTSWHQSRQQTLDHCLHSRVRDTHTLE